MTIANMLMDVEDGIYDLNRKVKDLMDELDATSTAEEVREAWSEVWNEFAEEAASILGVTFPQHWHPEDHPILSLVQEFKTDRMP